MVFEHQNNILKIKIENRTFIDSFNVEFIKKKYLNHDIIFIIDFLIDPNLIDALCVLTKELKKVNCCLLIVVNIIDEVLLNKESVLFVPSLEEAIDYIELERINKDLDL